MNVGYGHQYYNKLSSTTFELNIYFLYSVFYSRVRMGRLKIFQMGQKLFIFRIYVSGALLLRGREILQQACDVFVCSCKQILDSQYILEVDVLVPPICQSFFFLLLKSKVIPTMSQD